MRKQIKLWDIIQNSMLLGESSFWHNNCFNWMGLPINHRLRMVLASLFINWLSHWIRHPSVSQLLLENWRFLADWALQFWTIIIAKVYCMWWGTSARIYIFFDNRFPFTFDEFWCMRKWNKKYCVLKNTFYVEVEVHCPCRREQGGKDSQKKKVQKLTVEVFFFDCWVKTT